MLFNLLEQFIAILEIFNINIQTTNISDFDVSTTADYSHSQFLLTSWESKSERFPTNSVSLPKCCSSLEGLNPFNCNGSEGNKTVLRAEGDTEVLPINQEILTYFDYSNTFLNITFVVANPACSKGYKSIKINSTSNELEGRRVGRFTNNGYFGFSNEFYSPLEYCVNGLSGESLEVKACVPECSDERPCIQKCCDPDEIYSFSQRKCIKSNPVLYNPIFYHDMSNRVSEDDQKRSQPHFSIRFPRSFKHHCQENRTVPFPSGNLFAEFLSNSTRTKYYPADFRLRKDGTILYRKDGKPIVQSDGHPIYLKEHSRKCHTLKTHLYCLDGATEYGNENEFANTEGETFLVTCPELLYNPPLIGPLSFVYGNVMICSSFFSLLTVIVYLILKEKQNIHGWTVVSYATSMFFMYVFLGLAHLIRYYGSDEVLKTRACVFIGLGSHLFSLSSFLWLTVINWDLWWTFRPAIKTEHNLKPWNHYLKYSIVGWGVPLMIISVSSYLHFNFEVKAEDECAQIDFPLPAYGRESCEIKQLSLGVYLYFPATVLLLCNFVFFIVTTYALCKHERGTLIAVKRLERHHQSMQLFGKLFVVMGVTRVFEVITWAESGPTLTWYWAVFDIFNVLQAVAIFIIYVCKRDILRSLRKTLSSGLARFHRHATNTFEFLK